ncbi:MAG: PSD1 and planctomycete cytochrome C domain-containing protein, partial [Aureliella sp.]
MPHPIRLALIVIFIQFDMAVCLAAEPRRLEFNRDIRPILSDHCFACHGPDKNKREADVRLDTEHGLFDSEAAPVVRNDPNSSTLVQRITADDVEERMPPPEFGKDLSSEQIALLQQWIEQGADWQGHWSFQPISRPEPPRENTSHSDPHAVSSADRTNPVDAFVVAELEAHGLALSKAADRRTLARRLHFDLLGLPPSPEVVERFEQSDDPLGYEQMVNELLASPHFGERMAMWWLDLVRYADSVGYHGDQPVSVSPFRDYVIASFNNNKPFDRFTVEQLAGDLLPEPTREQLIAAGYNRLGMMSAEGGVQPKEYLAKYIAERVRNLGGTWLGVTLGCCECHDHKFDPFSAKDFYQFEAFFADIEERGLYGGDWGPKMSLPSAEQQAKLATLDADIATTRESLNKPTDELARAQVAWEADPMQELPAGLREVLAVAREARTPEQTEQLAAHYRTLAPELSPLREQLKLLEAEREQLNKLIPSMLVTKTVEPRMVRVLARGNWMDDSGIEVHPAIPAILGGDHFNGSSATAMDIGAGQQGGGADVGELKRRLNRLDLAEWVVADENPLTARVAVNRLWKLFFGIGLSSKLDDLGAQGEWPSHPELLDWLADEFRASNWNVKHIIKLMVMSDAYRQDSFAEPAI